MRKFALLVLFLLILGAVFFVFKSRSENSLVVYSGRAEALVAPILQAFEAQTGIKLDIRYNATPALATQLLSEGKDSPADVVFFQDPGYLGVVAGANLLAPLSTNTLEQVAPRFRSETGHWVGTSARARVLVYDPTRIHAEELPKTLYELSDPKWKGLLGWAPGNGSAQAHMAALLHLWGEARFRDWLKAMHANDPIVYPRNAAIVTAVGHGEILIGWANHYYLYQLKKLDPSLRAENYHFPVKGDAGNLLMVAGAGVHVHSPRKTEAEQLVAFLVSEQAQNYFAQEGAEYPTRPGIATYPGLTPLEDIGLVDVSQSWMSDVAPVLAMLREYGIQ